MSEGSSWLDARRAGGWLGSARLSLFPLRMSERFRRILLAPLYRLYTDGLRRSVASAPLPGHVAVILDGNRRGVEKLFRVGHAVAFPDTRLEKERLGPHAPREILILRRARWGRSLGLTRTLDSHASRLRRKLNTSGRVHFVLNVWGVGYRLIAPRP